MIDYTSVRRSVEKTIADNFSEVPIQYENTTITDAKEFIALFDQETTSDLSGFGSNIVLVRGGIVIQIFTPLHEGTQRGREIASSLANLINTLETDTVHFSVAVLASVGAVEDANFYQQNLTIPYIYSYAGDNISC